MHYIFTPSPSERPQCGNGPQASPPSFHGNPAGPTKVAGGALQERFVGGTQEQPGVDQ